MKTIKTSQTNHNQVNQSKKTIKQQISDIVKIYNDICATEDKALDRNIAFKQKVNNFITKDCQEEDENFRQQLENNANEIYDSLSSAYKDKEIPRNEINNYIGLRQTNSFVSYICCCRRQQDIDPQFVNIILKYVSVHNFIIEPDGNIETHHEGLVRIATNF